MTAREDEPSDLVKICKRMSMNANRQETKVIRHGLEIFHIVKALQPDIVIEIGVARGLSTRCILTALMINGHGKLHSIDMENQWSTSGLIEPQMMKMWQFYEGESQEVLPVLLKSIPKWNVFLHDGAHDYQTVKADLDYALRYGNSTGVVILDDFESSRPAWDEITAQFGLRKIVLKGGLIGVATK